MSVFKTSDGIKIFYQFTNKESSKTPIVFVHGFAVNWTCFKNEIKYLKKENHPILYFDLRGHGKSGKSKDSKGYTFERFEKDLLEILKQNNIKRKIILVGHSLGGMISINFASNFSSKIEKLVIIDSADKAPNQNKLVEIVVKNKELQNIYLFLGKHHHKNNGKEIDITEEEIHENPKRFFVKQIFNNDPKSMLEITNTMFSNKKVKVNKITCPMLILGSDKDELFSKKEELEIFKKIDKAIIKFLPGRHDIILRHPEIISQEIKQFIHTKDSYFLK